MSDLNKSPADVWIELEKLRAENAALKEASDFDHKEYKRLRDDLKQQLLAAQHRIKELREAIESALSDDQPYIDKCKAALATHDNTAELDALVKDAERWKFVMMTEPYACNLWNALPKDIYKDSRHLNTAIDAAMKADHAP